MSTPGPLTFDLSELEFIDSTALLVLWEAAAEVAPHGGLTVVDPKPRVRTVLAITGFERAPGVNIVSRGRAVPPPG
jgi:anti-anti-sigma factor